MEQVLVCISPGWTAPETVKPSSELRSVQVESNRVDLRARVAAEQDTEGCRVGW